ncbi:hypothetical protein CYLTODRAFT_429232 [Cylindrobasidium torrendii FP15055 ss-10]|uniref:Peptidase M20 domain-containing protein 2 n=1 Tax=Cylindrobasidium torrendii FP15055 ss-10 TaxID=1314674 RepID=A0A0D7BMS0_9AGAR|nr:hypothetical protein CYLTODRAFT_429232 [Cylindrobasidium torrendii FP15055 ss-10]
MDDFLPAYSRTQQPDPAEVVNIVNSTIASANGELRALSLDIHDHPETAFKEKHAHDVLTAFVAERGFTVQKHYLGLDTAWRAEFSYGHGGRVIGINSEMDALAGIGHACGHNLIAAGGVAVALALKQALVQTNTAGKVVLLGTPAEEGGGGKVILLERGGYTDMDVCVMSHPMGGPVEGSVAIGSSSAIQTIDVEYTGHTAHAAAAPWEGTNALDAAFIAYSSIAVLRQQMKPECRVHGRIGGKDWLPNVIPDNAALTWIVRAPTNEEVTDLMERVRACFDAAALATGCKISVKYGVPYSQLVPNPALALEFVKVANREYKMEAFKAGTSASTDFGNVSFELPSLHPNYAIPTEANGGNHTAAFAKSARTMEAHDLAMKVAKALAITAYKVVKDDAFYEEVKSSFKATKATRC